MKDQRQMGFQDIRVEVMTRIQSRVWPQGHILPTEMELAEEFGCARATVNRAMRELAEEGIVTRKRKGGTRVATSPPTQTKLNIEMVRKTIEDMNAVYRYARVSRKVMQCPGWLKAKLGLSDEQEVLHLQCLHHADNRPFQFEDRWINIDAVPGAVNEAFDTVGPNEWLLAQVPFSDAEIVFSAIPASVPAAEFLSVPTATPLFQLERTTWFQDQPVTFVRMTFHQGYEMRSRS